MEIWVLICIISLCMSPFFKVLFSSKKPRSHKLPPGPLNYFPIIANLLYLPKSLADLHTLLRSLHAVYGPILTLHLGPHPCISVADRHLAHYALIRHGAVFADRPPASGITKIITSNQQNISSAFYGPTWGLFRRNLIQGILHPSRVKSYSRARNWVLQILLHRFKSSSAFDNISIMEHFQYAMFCLLSLMCFGDKVDEIQIEEIMRLERAMFLENPSFSVLNFWPWLSKIVLRERWSKLLQLRKKQEDYLIPLIRERKKMKHDIKSDERVLTYVDTLLEMEIPGEKRSLSEEEMVTLCNEFLNGGTDTTSTALEWIMANLVKYPHIQEKLFMEIKGIVGDSQDAINEEDLEKMSYLRAVILEGLRRHPPAHFVLPHAVTEDVILGNYLVPKNGIISFMVADVGWDSKVWKDDPMAFKPERFMGCETKMLDVTGSKEIKMMPFGVGRRICPAYSLAMLHLEYFVANLVWNLEWKALDGDDVDLSEKQEITMVMKNPLKAQISIRSKNVCTEL